MRRLPACVVPLLLAVATVASAQNRLRATAAAALLKEPGGLRIGSLVSGVTYPTGRTNSGHVEATVEGWIPAASTTGTTRDGFDLTVISGSGEAVRAAPGGAIIARVQEGTLLSKVGTRGTWLRIRRAGWVARGSLAAGTEVAAAKPADAKPPEPKPDAAKSTPAPPPPPPPPAAVVAAQPAPTPPVKPSVKDTVSKPDASKGQLVSDRAAVRKGAELVVTPEGGRIASIGEATDAQVVERRPGWVKVLVEGWVKETDVAADVASGPRITGAMVRERPDKYVGETVTWRIQYLAVQEADELRPEMPRGQPYILARGPLPESGFVYLMVSKEQAVDFKARAPLDEITVEATIKAGRTRYLPTPVLALVNVSR